MHELEELPADPSADPVELSGGRFWIVEVCDSVVDWSYTRLNEQRPHRALDLRPRIAAAEPILRPRRRFIRCRLGDATPRRAHSGIPSRGAKIEFVHPTRRGHNPHLAGDDSEVELGNEPAGFLARVESMRRIHTRERALRWSYAVNYRIGAVVAVALLPTRVSANTVTVAALALNTVGAAFLVLVKPPASWVDVVLLLVIWQLAYSLDCADGLLARARGRASPFGAWLDQVADFVGHVLMFGALAVFVARALSLSAPWAAAVAGAAVAGSVIQLFASSQRNSIMGTEPAVSRREPRWLHVALLAQHLADYGLWLLILSVLLLVPWALLGVILGFAALSTLAVTLQVALNWRAQATRGAFS